MQIIDVGICIDNLDPKGVGRIRITSKGDPKGPIEGSLNYEYWDKNDPFVALPFLPLHVNVIPQKNQAVKIIKYDNEKEAQNLEYIAGPFSSPHDFQNQVFTDQHIYTTHSGNVVIDKKDIRTKDGDLNKIISEGCIIKFNDIGIRGNYGSDLIFTENGLQLRGGMLVDKRSGKKGLLDYPILSDKMGRFNLKKFGNKTEMFVESESETIVSVSRLNYIVEYEIDSLNSPSELRLFVYKVNDIYSEKFNSNAFTESTIFSDTDVKLINIENDAPTYTVLVDGSITGANVYLRDILYEISQNNLTVINELYPNEDIFPFFFRPSEYMKSLIGENEEEKANKTLFLSKTQVGNKYQQGLVYSRKSADPPSITINRKFNVPKVQGGTEEQSFASLSADKIYLTSTSPNSGFNVKTIDFKKLNEYELTQEDYIKNIDPNTYSLVRGENLLNFLKAVYDVLTDHVHNINKPYAKLEFDKHKKMSDLFQKLEDDILNKSIKIN
jgi:hypothetical protein